jgi:hypothetical protein
MGWIVIKVNRDPGEDRWCLWSSNSDEPVFDGTEKDMIAMYLFEFGNHVREALRQRIERAKIHGGGTDWLGDWDDNLVTSGTKRGVLPRAKLADLLDIYAREGSREEVQALLEPFED